MTWSSRQQLGSPVRWRNETRVVMNVSTIETKPQESIEVQPQESITPRLETSPVHVKGILAATDFSEQATLALKFAARLARRLHSRLHVLYNVTPQLYVADTAILSAELLRVEVERREHQLNEYASKIPEVRTMRHEEIALCGSTIDQISAVAEMKGIDLVVMGSHGRGGLKKMVLGSVAEAAISRLHCPVLVVGPRCTRRFGPLKSMAFATDLRADSLRAAQYAMSIARQSQSALTVVHVVPMHIGGMDMPDMDIHKHVAKELRQLIPRDPELERHVDFEIAAGNTANEILRIAKQSKAGLIVMGAHEHSALADHDPWSTLSAVIRESHCPVLAVQSHFA